MSSAARETYNSLGHETTLMSRFKEVQVGSIYGWNPGSSKSVERGGFLVAKFSLEINTKTF